MYKSVAYNIHIFPLYTYIDYVQIYVDLKPNRKSPIILESKQRSETFVIEQNSICS